MKKRLSADALALIQEFDRLNALRAQVFYDDDALEAGKQPAPNTLHWQIAVFEKLVAASRAMGGSPATIDRYERQLDRLYRKEYRRYQLARRTGSWSID